MTDNEPIDIDDILAALAEDVSWQVFTEVEGQSEPVSMETIIEKWETPPGTFIPDKPGNKRLPGHILIERQPAKRKYIAGERLQELSLLMPRLPDPDTDVYIVATGRGKPVKRGAIVRSFGFGNFIEYIIAEFGHGCTLHISTWSLNPDHVYMLLELLDSGALVELTLICDPSLRTRKPAIMATLKVGMSRFPGCHLVMAKNHAKIYCMKDVDGDRFCTITGSANLSGTPRSENYTVSTDPGLYHHFITHFFNVMVNEDER